MKLNHKTIYLNGLMEDPQSQEIMNSSGNSFFTFPVPLSKALHSICAAVHKTAKTKEGQSFSFNSVYFSFIWSDTNIRNHCQTQMQPICL